MGLPMAKRLANDGFNVSGFDIKPWKTRPYQFTPKSSDTVTLNALTGLTNLSLETILVLVVRDEQQILDVCFEQQAVYTHCIYPLTLVICSTVSTKCIERLAKRLPKDVTLVDAPMSGAPYSAASGSLTFMLGGQTDDIEPLMPMFRSMGHHVHHLGPVGTGMAAKVLNNYVAASSVVTVRRALHWASMEGINVAKLLDVMAQSSGSTWYGNNIQKIDWSKQSYDSQNTIGILEKDVRCALDSQFMPGDEFDNALLLALKALPGFPDE